MQISLTTEQWTTVLQILAEQPFRVSAPLIQAIQQQARSDQPEPAAAARGNGLDALHP